MGNSYEKKGGDFLKNEISDLRGMTEGRQSPAIVSVLEALEQRIAKIEKKLDAKK